MLIPRFSWIPYWGWWLFQYVSYQRAILVLCSFPDIVESYSENIVDTFYKRNLLLVKDPSHYVLKTFPKRKVCRTIVRDTFGIILSQWRHWINLTICNLAELVFFRDLCGTFCSHYSVVWLPKTDTVLWETQNLEFTLMTTSCAAYAISQ